MALTAEGDPPAPAGGTPAPQRVIIEHQHAAPPTPPAPPAPAAPPAQPAHTKSISDYERDIADARADAAANRISARNATEQVQAAQAQIEQIRQETDRRIAEATTPLTQRQTKLLERLSMTELKAEAAKAGLVDMDLLPLIDRSKISVTDDGEVTGVAEAVAQFKQSKPSYFQAATTGQPAPASPPAPQPLPRATGATTPPPNPTQTPPSTDVRGMNRADYAAFKRQEIQRLTGVTTARR
jgi:hypothetical protein